MSYLIPESWTAPIVAESLHCDLGEAQAFIADHQDEDLLLAVEQEAFRRDLDRLTSINWDQHITFTRQRRRARRS